VIPWHIISEHLLSGKPKLEVCTDRIIYNIRSLPHSSLVYDTKCRVESKCGSLRPRGRCHCGRGESDGGLRAHRADIELLARPYCVDTSTDKHLPKELNAYDSAQGLAYFDIIRGIEHATKLVA